jgi:ribonuclease PH
MQRKFNRELHQLRPIEIIPHFTKHAEGSVLVKTGDTHVLCNASIQNKVPPFLFGKKSGWVTAEYSMLPRSTHSRINRDSYSKSPNGRAMEIQRLIGRSLRACIDLKKLGEKQVIIDCDVLQADGGTRCAAINGGFVALHLAIIKLLKRGELLENPIKFHITAASCFVKNGEIGIDPDYNEDSSCDSDINFVLSQTGQIIEVQGTAENKHFTFEDLLKMEKILKKSNEEILKIQKSALV